MQKEMALNCLIELLRRPFKFEFQIYAESVGQLYALFFIGLDIKGIIERVQLLFFYHTMKNRKIDIYRNFVYLRHTCLPFAAFSPTKVIFFSNLISFMIILRAYLMVSY